MLVKRSRSVVASGKVTALTPGCITQPSKQGKVIATCDVCGKQLARQSDMPRHKRLHDPEPERWMHWCPEPGCGYGSMQRSNLRNHVRKHTGQRLRCPDDSACNYSTFDKSALLRHRQRRHGYQTKSTAPKDRCQRIPSAKRTGFSSREVGNPSSDGSSSSPSSPLSETAPTKCLCPCPCPRSSLSPSSSSSNLNLNLRAEVGMDVTDEWLDDDRVLEAIEQQPVGSIEQSAVEGHVISRFPVSFARTRLAAAANFKHCQHCTCKLPTKPVRLTSNSATSTSNAEVMVYKHHVRYLVKELFLMATHARERDVSVLGGL